MMSDSDIAAAVIEEGDDTPPVTGDSTQFQLVYGVDSSDDTSLSSPLQSPIVPVDTTNVDSSHPPSLPPPPAGDEDDDKAVSDNDGASSPAPPSPLLVKPPVTPAHEGVFFNGIHYLGSSTVDAPVSETEANRKMKVLKTQAGEPVPITLRIPPNNIGDIMLHDPSTNHTLTSFPIRHILFCARGDVNSDLSDCLALNVVHKSSGVYHCHVFLCEIPEAVSY